MTWFVSLLFCMPVSLFWQYRFVDGFDPFFFENNIFEMQPPKVNEQESLSMIC